MQIDVFNSKLLSSNEYILEESKHAIIIDPYCDELICERVLALTKIDYIILTHEHYDHISGTNLWRERTGAKVLCSAVCAERIQNSTDNFSRYFNAYAELQTGEKISDEILLTEDFVTSADETFAGRMSLDWQGHCLELTETPGHSPGSICVLLDGISLFSGDSLLPSGKVMTRFPGGSKKQYEEQTLPYIRSLSSNVTVYPGHYEAFRLGDHPDV